MSAAVRLLCEAEALAHYGLLGEDGQVRCPFCGRVLSRFEHGDRAAFRCLVCDWRVEVTVEAVVRRRGHDEGHGTV